MNKEREIINMLEYITKGYYHGISKYNNTFKIDYYVGKNFVEQEAHVSKVDFENKTCEIYSYDISHHNGDHYNCITNQLKYNDIDFDRLHNYLTNIVKKKAKEDVIREMTESRARNIIQGFHK